MQQLTFEQEDQLNNAFNKHATDRHNALSIVPVSDAMAALNKANYNFVVAVAEIGKSLR